MTRPTRPLLSGAFYHVTARGNRRATMFVDDLDYLIWLKTLGETAHRYAVRVCTLCLMPNHFHLLLQTEEANLSAAMHYLNSKYAQKFNWRHALTGHVLQGRFHSVLIEQQEHVVELLRYIVLNPVRAKLVEKVDDWRWSTYAHICGRRPRPAWLNVAWVLEQFDGRTLAERVSAYEAFVHAQEGSAQIPGIPRRRRSPDPGRVVIPLLEQLQRENTDRASAIYAAWACGAYTREQIARFFGVSTRTVSRVTAEPGRHH